MVADVDVACQVVGGVTNFLILDKCDILWYARARPFPLYVSFQRCAKLRIHPLFDQWQCLVQGEVVAGGGVAPRVGLDTYPPSRLVHDDAPVDDAMH